VNVSTLHDPEFWKTLFENLPSSGARDVEEQALAAAAAAAGVSYTYAKARLQDYLSGRLEKPQPTDGDVLPNPFAPSPYWHRSNKTIH
jgi:hypothetical protein